MSRRILTPGKIRRLQTVSSPAGVFKVLAVDHQRPLIEMLDGRVGEPSLAERVTNLKLSIVRLAAPLATAVILDFQYGILPAISSGALPGSVGLIAAVDGKFAGGHSTEFPADGPLSQVRQARQIGANAVKLYLPYHPDDSLCANAQEEVVRQVVRQCAADDLPLFLEPVAYSFDSASPITSRRFADQRRQVAIRTVERLGQLGPDVLKIQFPVDARQEPNEAAWRAACAELNDAAPVPWTLLTGGDPFEMYLTQLQIACEAGCAGFLAGRTVWSDVAAAVEGARDATLTNIVRPRLKELNRVADRFGHGWQEKSTCLQTNLAQAEFSETS